MMSGETATGRLNIREMSIPHQIILKLNEIHSIAIYVFLET